MIRNWQTICGINDTSPHVVCNIISIINNRSCFGAILCYCAEFGKFRFGRND